MTEPVVPSSPTVPNDTVAQPPRRRRDPVATRQRWVERLQRFRECQRTIAQFCADEGVSVPAFYFWKRTLATTPPDHQPGGPANAPELIPVRIAPPAPALEVLLRSGALLRFGSDLDPQQVATLLRAVGAIPC